MKGQGKSDDYIIPSRGYWLLGRYHGVTGYWEPQGNSISQALPANGASSLPSYSVSTAVLWFFFEHPTFYTLSLYVQCRLFFQARRFPDNVPCGQCIFLLDSSHRNDLKNFVSCQEGASGDSLSGSYLIKSQGSINMISSLFRHIASCGALFDSCYLIFGLIFSNLWSWCKTYNLKGDVEPCEPQPSFKLIYYIRNHLSNRVENENFHSRDATEVESPPIDH